MAKQSRYLTYLFCDLVGSTELTRGHGPDDAFELIVGFQDACRACIERFKGYVACYMGDGVVGYFGYPIAMESSAEAAIRCAIELRRHIKSLPEPTLSLRIGIASGWGVLGEVRVGGHTVEVAAVSDAANLAARLEGAAAPDEILIADSVFREVEGLFAFHPARDLELKGFAQRQRVHPVSGDGDFRSRSHRSAEHTAGVPVGREAQLQALLTHWEENVRQGRGRSALARGPAGIGKSTLLRALRGRIDDPHHRVSLYASRFEEHTAFHAFRVWLQDLLSGQPAGYVDTWLADLLPQADVAPTRETLDLLLGRKTQSAWPAKLVREKIAASLVTLMLALSRQRPLLLLIEDIHWLDPSSIEIIAALQARCVDQPLFLMASARPKMAAGFGRWDQEVELGTLVEPEVRALIADLDPDKRLTTAVRSEIAVKAEGIPLLLREFTLATLAAGDGQGGAISIPDSLLESFGARIEAQTQDPEVIGAAAAIGEAFSTALLAQTMRRTEDEIEAELQAMCASELLLSYSGAQGRHYDFSHALLRDAAYRSLVRKQRIDLHRKILATNRAMDPDWERTQPLQAAHHLQAIDAHADAAQVLLVAAHLRFAASQFAETSGLIAKALGILPNVGDEQLRLGLELQLQTLLGLTLTQLRGFGEPEANRAYSTAWSICGRLQRSGEPEFCAIWGIWAHKLVVSDTTLSRTLTQNLDRIADSMQRADLALLARAAGVVTGHCISDFPRVRRDLDAVLAAYDPKQHGALALSYSMDPRALALLFAAHSLAICGEPERAAWARDEAIAQTQRLGYEFLQPYATIFGWGSSLYTGADESVLAILDAGMAQAERIALPFWVVSGMMWKGIALYQLGRYAQAEALLRPGLETAHLIGLSLVVPYMRAIYAAALTRLGGDDTALPLFEQSLAQIHSTGENFALAEVHRLYGEALLRIAPEKNAEAARRQFTAALEVAQAQGAVAWTSRVQRTLAEFGLG